MSAPTGWVESPTCGVSYPAAPWDMAGQGWLTLFRLAGRVEAVMWVDYRDPSPLTYSELLVAHPRPGTRGQQVTISEIWVDSPASVAGGRELWAIPKGLCTFAHQADAARLGSHDVWEAYLGEQLVVSSSFRDASALAPRLPSKGGTWQPGIDGGPDREAALSGSARVSPARARWTFAPDGPLARFTGARQLASVRMRDFRMSFG